MLSDKGFLIAVVISLVTHGIILLQNPNLHLPTANKREEPVEVRYVQPYQEKQAVTASTKESLPLPPTAKITAKKTLPPPFIEKGEVLKEKRESILKKPNFTKPAFMKTDVISVKKMITLPPVDMDKINNPSYINYYQIVREKIRRAAYQNYTRTDVGEVYLSFIISKAGNLRDLRLIEEKSSDNAYLRDIALKSIKAASPFPLFPDELDYPQLSFNVVISFEVE